ncbi:ABC transporter substrate-binding protein [Brachybacterium sp. DNPG3]
MDRRQFARTGLVGMLGAAVLGTAACTAAGSGSGAGAAGAGGAGGAPDDGASAEGFPLTVANCEAELTFAAPPQRLVLLESAPVTILDGIGALDRVVARAGDFPGDYYDADLAARIAAIPMLSDELDASGHLQISQEVVIAQQPDLVLGLPDGITREGMRDAGAEVLVQSVYCGGLDDRASFDTLHEEIALHGRILGRAAEADALIAALDARIAAVGGGTASDGGTGSGGGAVSTAAVLYPSLGGGPLYAYGAASMVTAQLDALGIENVFASTTERVFEVGAEPLLAADPDVLIVLHQSEGDGSDVVDEMVGADQLQGLAAVRAGSVLPLLFNFCEPATPLVVDGLERIAAWVQELGA